MQEARGDLWNFYEQGHWVCVLTNGIVRQDGHLVMGRGVARQAADRIPELPSLLGALVKLEGNHVYPLRKYRITSFPTKNHWRDSSCLSLIQQSAEELMEKVVHMASETVGPIYLPRPGCGLGGLEWTDVKPVLEKVLDDRIVIVTW